MGEIEKNLIQVVYCSAASPGFSRDELQALLRVARKRNAQLNITGMLLYAGRSFIQVLEGQKTDIDQLVSSIKKDERHRHITFLLREPIAKRSFGEWSMGYADLPESEVEQIIGPANASQTKASLSTLGKGRAKKLLDRFKQGRWRAKIKNDVAAEESSCWYRLHSAFPPAVAARPASAIPYSFAFQPIVNAEDRTIFSYEALLRGKRGELAPEVLQTISPSGNASFQDESRLSAIHWAAHLGLCTHLNLNIMPSAIVTPPFAIPSVLDALRRFKMVPRQLILEILENEIVESVKGLSAALRSYRSTGLLFAIDDFGAGYAGLNLLAEFQPDFLKLDKQLVRHVEKKGPRQAIIRGIVRTCFDLGIEIVAEGVETQDEFRWLRDEGIKLFQGYHFAKPAVEKLPASLLGPV